MLSFTYAYYKCIEKLDLPFCEFFLYVGNVVSQSGSQQGIFYMPQTQIFMRLFNFLLYI